MTCVSQWNQNLAGSFGSGRLKDQGTIDGVLDCSTWPQLALAEWRRAAAARSCRVKFVDGVQKREETLLN
jgi:hypothetical protein